MFEGQCCRRPEFLAWDSLPALVQHLILLRLGPRDLARLSAVSRAVSARLEGDEALWDPERLLQVDIRECLKSTSTRNVRSLRNGTNRALCQFVMSGNRFHGQIFNREMDNPSEDFTNSCYDATVQYQGECPATGAHLFTALYLPQGRERVEEKGVLASRLRPAPAGTHSHRVLRWSVDDVQPGSEVEVQWRGDKRHPYGWWWGLVRTVLPRSVIIEFPQYPQHSPWRNVVVPVESGKEGAVNRDQRYGGLNLGFLGGLRVLSPKERAVWQGQRTCAPPSAGASTAAEVMMEGEQVVGDLMAGADGDAAGAAGDVHHLIALITQELLPLQNSLPLDAQLGMEEGNV